MKKSFSSLYPYLAWWCENHGYIQLGADDENPSGAILMIIDAGGVCWEDENSDNIDDALKAAEKYLKEVEILKRFGDEVVAEIEGA